MQQVKATPVIEIKARLAKLQIVPPWQFLVLTTRLHYSTYCHLGNCGSGHSGRGKTISLWETWSKIHINIYYIFSTIIDKIWLQPTVSTWFLLPFYWPGHLRNQPWKNTLLFFERFPLLFNNLLFWPQLSVMPMTKGCFGVYCFQSSTCSVFCGFTDLFIFPPPPLRSDIRRLEL